MPSTQPVLTTSEIFNANNLRFSKPKQITIQNSKPLISYQQIPIRIVNPNGQIGDLFVPIETALSYGVSVSNMNGTDVYQMSFNLYGRDGPSDSELAFVNMINAIVEKSKDYIIEKREELKMFELERNDMSLKKLNPIYQKKENGKIVEGKSPQLYPKLMMAKNKETGEKYIDTKFFDMDDVPIDPMNILNKKCEAHGVLKFECIHVGSTISIQYKLYDCRVDLIDNSYVRLLPMRTVIQNSGPSSTKTSPASSAVAAPTPAPKVEPVAEVAEDTEDEDEEDEKIPYEAPVMIETRPSPPPPAVESAPAMVEESSAPPVKKVINRKRTAQK
jgi:hypothetical protein